MNAMDSRYSGLKDPARLKEKENALLWQDAIPDDEDELYAESERDYDTNTYRIGRRRAR